MTTLYLAGPMSGYEDYNFAAFNDAAERLRAVGYRVINPAEVHADSVNLTWATYMRADLIELLSHAQGVATLVGWSNSQGAQLEVYVAASIGMKCQLVERWIEESGA